MKVFGWGSVFLLALVSSVTTHAGQQNQQQMDMQKLKAKAFAACQAPYAAPVIVPVPMLDPPADGEDTGVGMVFQEELAVRTTNLLDQNGFYFSPRPRAAVNNLPMDIFIDPSGAGNYVLKTWEDAHPDYSSDRIVPTINPDDVPAAGRVLTELIIGHQSPQGDYPQLFDLRSSAYIRFAGFPPQITGASMRLAAHKLFSQGGPNETNVREDFPIIRSMYVKVKDPTTAQALVFVESDLFCGALNMEMTEGNDASIVVDGYWFTRRDFDWQNDRHTGLVAYSSMLFKNETNATDDDQDEAHDSDTLRVSYPNGQNEKYVLALPDNGLAIREFDEPTEWTLANEDRDPDHYADFAPALGATNYNFRASYRVHILESNIKMGLSLYAANPNGEYGDNIVAVSTIRQNFKKAQSVDDAIHFKYETTAFLSPWP